MTAGERLFGDMSEPVHAYALGVVAAAGRDRQGTLEVRLEEDDAPLLDLLRPRSAQEPLAYELRRGRVYVAAPASALAAGWLAAAPGDTGRLEFPTLRRELGWAFVRGLFDASGHVSSPRRPVLRVRLQRPGARLLEGLLEFLALGPDRVGKRWLHWSGHNALDLLGHLYEPCAAATGSATGSATPGTSAPGTSAPDATAPCRAKPFARYLAWAQRMPPFQAGPHVAGPIRWTAVHPDARPPFKQRITDSGYDLTLLYEKKRVGACVLYGTGLVIKPPYGWYLDVVPRSSIIKSGYLLANNVGVIDRGYRGEILVPLIKVDPEAPDLELPAQVMQMVPRPIVHLGLERIEASGSSHRGSGGFGSTGS